MKVRHHLGSMKSFSQACSELSSTTCLNVAERTGANDGLDFLGTNRRSAGKSPQKREGSDLANFGYMISCTKGVSTGLEVCRTLPFHRWEQPAGDRVRNSTMQGKRPGIATSTGPRICWDNVKG